MKARNFERKQPTELTIYYGKIKCADCGNTLTRKKGRSKIYYYCSSYVRNNTCTSHGIKEEQIEAIVLQLINKQIELVHNTAKMIDKISKNKSIDYDYEILMNRIDIIEKEKEKYLNQYQREPTIQELSQNLNIEKQNIIEAMQSTQSIASFQDAVGNDDQNELSLSDIISLDPETLKHYHDHLDLKNAFDCLNQREKKVIQERYYQGYSQCEIADELFVSQAQISRIEKKALEKLHKKLV